MHPSKNPVQYIRPEDANSYESVYAMLKTIAFKEGELGEILAKGSFRARDELGFGTEFLQICYVKDGFNDHCGSRWSHNHHFPFWIWAAMSRSVDYRDTADDITHGLCHLEDWASEYGGWLSWDQMNEAAMHIWGEPSFNPEYKNKEQVEFWFLRDCKFLTSLVLCDWLYWYRTLGLGQPEPYAVINTPQGKTYEGQDLGNVSYNLVTGNSIDKEEQLKIGERILNQERAIYIREGHLGRKPAEWFVKSDEAVIPFYVKWGDKRDGIHLDADEFRALMDRFYALAGWDQETGRPTREKYEDLGLKYVADELETLGKLP
jgi:aldehyde:ferredoxin oxidoreductase